MRDGLDAIVGQACASALDAEDVRRASDVAAAEARARGGRRGALFHQTGRRTRTRRDERRSLREGNLREGNLRGTFGNLRGKLSEKKTLETFEGDDALAGDFGSDALTRRGGVTLVQEGDAASTLRATRGAGSLAAALEGTPVASVSCDSTDECELRMWRLASTAIPGADRLHMPEEPGMDDDRCGARKTSLATYVPSPDVPLQVLERRELMNAAAALLPPGVDDDHADELRRRRHGNR